MKSILIATAVCLVGLLARADSPPPVAGDVLAALRALEAENKVLLERQQKTLEKLEEMGETARQTRIFARRG